MGTTRLAWIPAEGEPRFEGSDSWGHLVRTGGTRDRDGGKPSDLLPLSLAACTAYDVVVILRKQRQDLRALEITVESEQDPDPPWTFRRIRMHFAFTGPVDPTKARKAIELSEQKYCAVAATIRPSVAIESTQEIRDPS